MNPAELQNQEGVDKSIMDLANIPALRFSPITRMFAGSQAAKARNSLGPAVALTNSMRAAWSSVNNRLHKMEIIDKLEDINESLVDKTFRIIRTPKSEDTDKARQRELTWAMIAFGSDPKQAVKPYYKLFDLLHDAYFDIKLQEYDNKNALKRN